MDKILNLECLLIRLGGDIELINELLHLFLETAPEQVDTLREAVDEKNTEHIQKRAHTIKGSAGNISAEKLARTASRLETAGKEGNKKGVDSLFSIFQKEYKELEIEIKKSFDKQ